MNERTSGERKPVEKVVKGTAKIKKKSEVSKFTDIFVSEDISNVKSYLFTDVIIPSVKKVVLELFTEGIEMLLYGEVRGGRSKSGSVAGNISYNRYYDPRERDRFASDSRTSSRTVYNPGSVIVETRGEAEAVLARMDEIIASYGVASVLDLYELVGITGSFTDNKYGWFNIRNAKIVRSGGSYVIEMPKAMPID